MQTGKNDGRVDEDLTQLVGVGGRCSYVLFALLLVLILYPSLVEWAWGRITMGLLVSSIIVAIACAVGRSRQQMIFACSLSVMFIVAQWMYLLSGNSLVFIVGIVTFLLFVGYAIAHLFAYLMRRGRITGDKLHAALAIYILSAILWAGLYTLLNHVAPGSFLVNTERGGLPDFYEMLYFSFTTLTSTGYGDLTPASRQAESLAILEQIAGVFYVAVLIARLAGLYPQTAEHEE